MAEEKIERVFTVPLGQAYSYNRKKRVPRAVDLLRQFVSRHMKSDAVSISNEVNKSLWTRSMQKPPRRVKVKVVKKEGLVRVYLPDELTEDDKAKKKEAEEKAKKEAEEKAKKEAEQKLKAKKEAEETLASAKKAEAARLAAEGSKSEAKKEAEKKEAPKPEAKKIEEKK